MQNKCRNGNIIANIIPGLILFLIGVLPLVIDLHLVKPFSLCKLVLFYGTVLLIVACWLINLVPFRSEKAPLLTTQRVVPIEVLNKPSRHNTPDSNFNRRDRGSYSLFFQHTPLTYPVIAYISVVCLSTFFSPSKTISIFGYYVHYEGLLTSIGYIIIFFSVITYLKRHHIFYIIAVVSVACFVSSVYGVIQFLEYDPVTWLGTGDRFKVISTLGNPVFFSGYIVSVFPLILVGFLTQLKTFISKNNINTALLEDSCELQSHPVSEGGVKISSKKTFLEMCFTCFLFVVLVLMLFNLYTTKTRGAWLGFIFSILCLMILLYLDLLIKHKTKTIILAIGFIITFGVIIGFKYKHTFNQLIYLLKQRGDIVVALTNDVGGNSSASRYFTGTRGGQSILYRIIQYKSAVDMIGNHPLTGIGPDVFGSALPGYAFSHFKQTPDTPPFENVMGIHNDMLDKAATTGITGLGCYLWIIVAFILFIKRNFNRIEKGNYRLILSGILACLTGYLVQQQFTVIEYTITLHFWFFLAVGVLLVNTDSEKGSDTISETKIQIPAKKSNGRVKPRTITSLLFYICHLPIGGILVYGFYYLVNIYRADLIHKKGLDYLTYAKDHYEVGKGLTKNPYWQEGLEYYKASVLYNPWQTFYRHQLGGAYLFMLKEDLNNVDLVGETIRNAEGILEIDPNEDLACNYLANAYDLLEYNTNRNYSNKIIPLCEKAISINPYKTTYYDCLGTYYLKKELYEKAIGVFKQILRIKPDYSGIAEKFTNAYKPLVKRLILKDRLDEAEVLLNELSSIPHNDNTYFKKLKAIVYSKKGLWEDVIRESEQILALKSDDLDAHQNIATAHYAMRNYEQAKKLLEKILQLSPDDQPANALLQKISSLMEKTENK